MAGKTKPKQSRDVIARQKEIAKKCEALGENMRHWRSDIMKRTQKYVAEKIGKKQPELSKYESNATSLPVEVVFGYCDVLNVSVHDLFGETDTIEIDEMDVLAEYRKLSKRMQYYVYQMIREMNKR